MMRKAFSRAIALGGIALATLSLPTTAQAAHTVCTAAQLANAVGAKSCWYVVGNANSNSAAHRTSQAAAIGALGASSYVYNLGTNSSNSYLDGFDAVTLGKSVGFGQDLTGETIIGLHFGNGVGTLWRPTVKSPGNPGGVTAFYRFDFDQPTAAMELKNATALSNAHLYTTQPAVPEPSTWAMLLLGFFFVAGALRQRRSRMPGLLESRVAA